MSEGAKYQALAPAAELLDPGRAGKPKSLLGWAYSARTPDRELFLLYFEKDCPPAALSGAKRSGQYRARWFDPRKGTWLPATDVKADGHGKIALPPFPAQTGKPANSQTDWAMRVTLVK